MSVQDTQKYFLSVSGCSAPQRRIPPSFSWPSSLWSTERTNVSSTLFIFTPEHADDSSWWRESGLISAVLDQTAWDGLTFLLHNFSLCAALTSPSLENEQHLAELEPSLCWQIRSRSTWSAFRPGRGLWLRCWTWRLQQGEPWAAFSRGVCSYELNLIAGFC